MLESKRAYKVLSEAYQWLLCYLVSFSVAADSTDPPSLELKSKLDTSNFLESGGINAESKSFGSDASIVEPENEKPPLTGSYCMNLIVYVPHFMGRMLYF